MPILTMQRPIRSSQDLGEMIARARRDRALTQRQLAAEFGVSQAWLSRVECGQQKAWIGKVLRLASYLGITITAQLAASDESHASTKETTPYPDLDRIVQP